MLSLTPSESQSHVNLEFAPFSIKLLHRCVHLGSDTCLIFCKKHALFQFKSI